MPIYSCKDNRHEWRHILTNKLHRVTGPAVVEDNYECWYYNGEKHRDDGPAETYQVHNKNWYKNGLLHREGGPAKKAFDYEAWYQDGLLHREGGPAKSDFSDGTQEWFLFGSLHRVDGPAVKSFEKEEWYYYGLVHRVDGPAVKFNLTEIFGLDSDEIADGLFGNQKTWYINGKQYDEEDYHKRLRYLRFKYFKKWEFKCDQPGKKLFKLRMEKSMEGLKFAN